MNQTDMPREIDNLKRFLIFRLVVVMLFILISESLINIVFGQFALPRINSYFGTHFDWGAQSFDMNLINFSRIAAYVIFTGLSRRLPMAASHAISLFLQRYILGNMQQITAVSGVQRVFFLVLLFVILCTYLLPYVVGILYYSGVVVQKMEEIREYDRKQREEFTKRRNLLLSDITHDLKTPITTMAGYAQALNDGMVTDPVKQKKYLESIHRKSLEMSELITLLFHYVKMDSEGFALKMERANLSGILLQIAAGAYTDMEEAGMELDVDIPEEAIYAQLDKAQFTRAVTNLVSNAIRHTEKGTSVKISMTEEISYWTIRVMDTGVAIEESMLKTIFDPFVMGDESRNRRGGSGLGLSVTKKIIDMHGGKIYVEQPTESPYTKAFTIQIPKEVDYEYKNNESQVQ